MLKKFLFYFAIFLCSSGLLCRCTEKFSREDEIRSLSDVRWLPSSTFANSHFDFSLQTLSREGFFRLTDIGFQTDYVTHQVQKVTWTTKKRVLIELRKDVATFSAAQLVEGVRLGFKSGDPLLVEALSELLQNGREYSQGRIPFSSVGVRAMGAGKIQFSLRRHSPILLGLVLSHPGTWPPTNSSVGPLELAKNDTHDVRNLSQNHSYPGGPVRITNAQARYIDDAFTRASLVLSGEADFTAQIPPALMSVARKSERYQEQFSAWRLFLVINPSRSPLSAPEIRRELAHSIDPRELSRFVENFAPINRLLERRPAPEKVGWFASLEARANKRPLTQITSPLRLSPVLPYPYEGGGVLLSEAAANLVAQLGKVGVDVEILPVTFQTPSMESLNETELTLLFLPALPLGCTTWAEVFNFFSRRTNHEELEVLLSEWDFTRDNERVEMAIESFLTERESVVVPLGAARKAFLASPRLKAIQLSPFGFWDWSRLVLVGQ